MNAAADPTVAEIAALRTYLDAGSIKAAAHRLGLSEGTLKHQLRTLRQRLGVETNSQAVAALGLRST